MLRVGKYVRLVVSLLEWERNKMLGINWQAQ